MKETVVLISYESTQIQPAYEPTQIQPAYEPTQIQPAHEPTQIQPAYEPSCLESHLRFPTVPYSSVKGRGKSSDSLVGRIPL